MNTLSYSFKKTLNIPNINTLLVVVAALVVGVLSTYIALANSQILAYGDAEAHLNISKRVFDSLTPGLSQIGGVWLPFPQLVMLPFVWNNYLWQTGLAGSIASVSAFIWSAVALYKLAFVFTKNHYASLLAPLVFIANPNAIYLASTPMSELILFSTVVTSLYFLLKWVHENKAHMLVLAAFFGFLATLSRYDGWFLVILETIFVFVVTLLREKSYKKAESLTLLFSVFAFFGIGLWLFWNKLIFGNFLYFANSDYGSKAQQMWFYARGYLPTYHNAPLSVLYYAVDTFLVLGSIITVLALLGLAFFIIKSLMIWRKNYDVKELSLFILFFSFIFYSISLYTGQASLILPTFAKSWYQWDLSNVRYGVQMLIPASIFIAYLGNKIKILRLSIVILVIFQLYYLVSTNNIIVLNDGIRGLSSQAISKGPDAPPIEKWLKANYKEGKILMDDYRRPISAISAGIPLNNFIGVGNKPYWEEGLINPTKVAEWIILQKADTDAVWRGLKNKALLENSYANVYHSGNIWVYKLRPINTNFVRRQSQNLMLNNKIFTMKGANVYDLLALSREEINNILINFQDGGINTVRFWAFNKEGGISTEDFSKFDYVISEASKRNIYLIPVLGNQWEDYGGKKLFVKVGSEDNFYTNERSINQFKEQVKSVVTHQNLLSKKTYSIEPAILSWELLNEPRVEHDDMAKIISKWTEVNAENILLYDNNHLVSIGTEGFFDGNSSMPYAENHGSNTNTVCALAAIDMCSAHLYPKYFKDEPDQKSIETLLSQWQSISDSLRKPLYIGEVGYEIITKKSKTNLEKREEFFRIVGNTFRRKRISGAFIWNISIKTDDHFSLSFEDPADKKILMQWIGKPAQTENKK